MPDLTLYLGGTRSGKSACAEQEAMRSGAAVLYVATAMARPDDESMLERIRRHQARRPAHWRTLECGTGLAERLEKELAGFGEHEAGPTPVVLLDCVTMWVANILFSLPDPDDLIAFEHAALLEVQALTALMERSPCRWILVSGEVGLGGIQAGARERDFCDCLGMVNQLLAAKAETAWFCIAGKKVPLEG